MKSPSEHSEQVALVRYLTMRRIPFAAIPNGGKRDKVTACQLKAEGVALGFPDLIIFLDGLTLALELKVRTGGVVSPEQKEWLAFFSARPGWAAMVCRGAQEAIKFIEAKVP